MSIHFEWTKDISVGDDIIDGQHQKLLAQVNKIIDTILSGVTSEKVSEAISFFDKYIAEHLAYEEKYMLDRGYPDFEHHKKQHNEFVANSIIFKEQFDKGYEPKQLILDTEKYLGNWWLHHIGVEDKKYYLYFKTQK